MSTEAISPLRQRMIEDMTREAWCTHERSHISPEAVRCILKRSPTLRNLGGSPPVELHWPTGISILDR